ncbi:hypothetical protein LTR42_005495 [Elasticomyces elasticus]|nr:hypothetical protein LTR42_005495 [Elasticomyces elasticus]
MRLLNTTSYELKEFLGDRVPDYVIISHRWGDDETTYKDFRKGRNRASVGFEKVMDFCHFARSRVREWVWIDTVCIDKRSSAEVSEAVNSMYFWYQRARECYVLLRDVPPFIQGRDRVLRSVWTTYVVFLTRAWEIVGSKAHFAKEICAITGIPEPILTGDEASSQKCVAQKMSWMAGRQTTRPEDMAYALLGLCDVNMPLLYGEGGKAAFRRLQLQIIADSDDETIFAWQAMYGRALYNPNANRQTMLAQAPDAFSHAGDVLKIPASNEYYSHRPHYAMTNRGLLYQGRAKKLWKDRHGHDTPGHYMIHLNCFGPTCDRWPILVCKPLPEQMSYIRVQTQWAPQDLEAEYPEEDREDVELSHVYIV